MTHIAIIAKKGWVDFSGEGVLVWFCAGSWGGFLPRGEFFCLAGRTVFVTTR